VPAPASMRLFVSWRTDSSSRSRRWSVLSSRRLTSSKAEIDVHEAAGDLVEAAIHLLETLVDMARQVIEALVCPGGSLHGAYTVPDQQRI
jgi:hypothetical protein